MKKAISTIVIVIIVTVFFGGMGSRIVVNASSAEDLNDIYAEAYRKCSDKSSFIISDDYSAYSYLLHHQDQFFIEGNQIGVRTGFFESPITLPVNELKCLNQFIGKLNTLLQLGAVSVGDSWLIQYKPSLNNGNGKGTIKVQTMDLMTDARNHANELVEVFDNAPFDTAAIVAGVYFADHVKYGGAWDYKVYLGQNTRYYVPELNAVMTGETIGNFHYGYVGSSCFPETVLLSAAGIAQLAHGTSDSSYWDSYFDDPRDQDDIKWGINRYNAEN